MAAGSRITTCRPISRFICGREQHKEGVIPLFIVISVILGIIAFAAVVSMIFSFFEGRNPHPPDEDESDHENFPDWDDYIW